MKRTAKYLSVRINKLYNNIDEWIDKTVYSIKKKDINADGIKLPGLDILEEKKVILSFKPSGLYSFGVNIRIDLVSKNETNIIVDIAKETDDPDWHLISSEAGKKPKKLTKMILRNLLKRI